MVDSKYACTIVCEDTKVAISSKNKDLFNRIEIAVKHLFDEYYD